MNRLATKLSGAGVFILSAALLLSWFGLQEFRAAFVPPGYAFAPRDLYFFSSRSASISQPLPLSYAQVGQLAAALPDLDITAYASMSISVRVGSSAPTATRALLITDRFFSTTKLPVGHGRQLGSRDANSDGASCVVTDRIAGELGFDPSRVVGTTIGTTQGACVVVGVVAGAQLDYWYPTADVLLPLTFPTSATIDPKIKSVVNNGIVRTIVRRTPKVSFKAFDERLRATFGDRKERFVTVQAAEFLVPAHVRAAAATARIASIASITMALLAMLALVLLDVALADAEINTLTLLGARSSKYLRQAFRRNVTATAWSAVVSVIGLSAFVLASEGFVLLQSVEPIAVASIVAWLVVSGATAFSRFVRLVTVSRTAKLRRAPSTAPLILCLLVVQVGGTAILICAFAYWTAFLNLARVPLGADLSKTTVIEMRSDRDLDGSARSVFAGPLLEQLGTLAGAERASFALGNPMTDPGGTVTVAVEGQGDFLNGNTGLQKGMTPGRKVVGPGFARTIGAAILEGRDIEWSDGPGSSRVAVVNQAFAKVHWPNESAIGHRVKFRPTSDLSEDWAKIVGVISDVQHEGYRGTIKPETYVSGIRDPYFSTTMHLLFRGGHWKPEAVQASVNAIAPFLRVNRLTTLEADVSASIATLRSASVFMGAAAAMGLISLITASAFVVAAYLQARRKEIGIRLSLGQSRQDVIFRIGRSVGAKVGVASIVGLLIGVAAQRIITAFDGDIHTTRWLINFGVLVGTIAVFSLSMCTVALRWSSREPIEYLK